MKINFSNLAKLFLAGVCFVAVGCTDYGQDIENLNNRINALETETIAPLAADLKSVKEALEAAKSDLQSQINDNKVLINGLTDALETAKTDLTKAINDVKDLMDKRDAEFEKRIAAIEALNLEERIEALETFKTVAEQKIATLEGEVDTLHKKDDELEGLIKALDARLKANEALAAKNAEDIKTNKALFDEFKAATEETLRLLNEAVIALETRIGNLETAFDEYQKAIRKELDAHYAAFTEYTKKTDKAIADLIAENEAQQIAIDANAKAIGTLTEDLKKAKEELNARIDATNQALADYKAEMAKIIEGLEADIDANTKAIKVNEEAIKALQGAVETLQKDVKKLQEDLAALQTKVQNLIDNEIKALQDGMNALKGRLQSLVFVPEYKDGKATVEYALFGTTKVEALSTFKYQVHPATCAAGVEAADLKFVFSEALKTRTATPELNVVDVKVVDSAKGIIAVTAKALNLHAVYNNTAEYAVSLVFSHKVNEVENNIASCYTTLIAEKEENAAVITWSLNDGYKKAEELEYIATNTVDVLAGIDVKFFVDGTETSIADVEAAYGIKVVPQTEVVATYAPEKYTSALDNTEKLAKDVYNNVIRENYGYDVKLNVADKATVGMVETLSYGFDLVTVNDNAVVANLSDNATVEITKIHGYITLDPQTITWARSTDNEADGITPINPTTRLVATVAGKLLDKEGEELTTADTTYADIIADATKLQSITVNGAAIAAPYNVVLGGTNEEPTVLFEGFEWNKEYTIVASYEIDNMIAKISIVLTTSQNSSVVTLDPATITWNYAADKASEKGEATFRAVETKADNAELYADVIANGKLVSVTPATGFVFTAAGIEATGFAWNSTYAVEALYALENQLVTVKVAVETVKAPFVDLTINLAPAQWLLTKEFDNQSETPAEALLPVFEGLANLGDITAEAYLKDIFVDNAYTTDVDKANNETRAATKLVVAADGQSINSVYNLADFTAAIAPEKVDYVLNVTTWYGQKINFVKTLNIGLTPVEITLAAAEKNLVKDLQFSTAAESLAPIYENVTNVDKASITTAAEYLKKIFVDHALLSQEDLPYANTKLVVDPTTGATVVATYDYTDFVATPKTVTYKSTYKTWYGQVVVVNKTLTILTDTYNYQHVPEFVHESDGYFSNPLVKHLNIPTGSTLLDQILISLDMNTAFNVVGKAGNIIQYNDLAGLGLVSTFGFSKNPVDTRIEFLPGSNNLYYHGHDATVGVTAQLKLVNSNGVETILPTNFDAGQMYAGYYVKQLNPVNKLKAANLDIHVSKLAKEYTYYAVNQLKMTDSRDAALIAHGALVVDTDNEVKYANGGWVVGNGTDNGFVDGRSVADIYGLKFIEFSCTGIPETIKDVLVFNTTTGELYFNNLNQIQLTTPIILKVTAKITHLWADDEASFTVTLIPAK